MSQYIDLPAELKLQVASYLPSKDLAALARSSKEHIVAAREQLYHAPEILQPDEGHRLMLLLRTLFARPQLIESIRSLSLAVVDCSMPFDSVYNADGPEDNRIYWDGSNDDFWCSEYQAIQSKLIDRLEATPLPINRNCITKVRSWQTESFYCGLLMILPNLERLSLSCYAKSLGQPCQIRQFRTDVLPNRLCDYSQDNGLESSNQLLNLKKLELEGGFLSQHCQQFLELRCLKLGRLLCVDLISPGDSLCHLARVDVHIRLWGTFFNPPPFYQLEVSFRAMSRLEHVKLRVEIVEMEGLENFTAKYTSLLESLDASASTIETLDIVPSHVNDLDTFDKLDSIPDLANFIQMRKLALPFRPSKDRFKGGLPPNIETLDLFCTSPIHPSSLDGLIYHRLEFGILRRLDLFLQDESGFAVDDEAWRRFKKHGVSVYVWVREHTLMQAMPA